MSRTTEREIYRRTGPLAEPWSVVRLDACAESGFPKGAPPPRAELEFLPLHDRRFRVAPGHSTRRRPLAVRGTDHCHSLKDQGEVQAHDADTLIESGQ